MAKDEEKTIVTDQPSSPAEASTKKRSECPHSTCRSSHAHVPRGHRHAGRECESAEPARDRFSERQVLWAMTERGEAR